MLRLMVFVAVGVFFLAACQGSARVPFKQGERLAERELWDNAVLAYAKAVSLDPGNSRYKVALARAKLRASAIHFDRAKRYRTNGQLELAISELEQAVVLDPTNRYAQVELRKAYTEIERRRDAPSDIDRAAQEAARLTADLGPPKLDPTSNVLLNLNFPDSKLQEVYDALSKVSGINFIYDEKLDLKDKVNVELARVTFAKAMDILMLQYKHFYKVIDAHTILLAEDSRQKRQEYDDHVIRTFYLSNAETKNVQSLLRGLLQTRRVAENAELNALTIKDTPEMIKVAERIIAANDKAKGEVVVDMELLEINRTKTRNLGIDLTSKSLSLVFGSGAESLPLNNLSQMKAQSSWAIGPVPSVLLNFLKSDSDTKSLARPQIRILEGESGEVTIGDRVPIPATTFNASQTIGANIVPITSFTYQNVGIIAKIKPRVHHNREITLEVEVEISSLAGVVEGTGGVSQPIIGTRSVNTVIRLNDGETNLLAGLLNEQESTSLAGVPGISDLPILNRLFGNTNEQINQTEFVLSLTPHIIRVPNIEPIDLVPLWVGSEDKLQLRGVARSALGESPFASAAEWEQIEKQFEDLSGQRRSDEPPTQIKDLSEGKIETRELNDGREKPSASEESDSAERGPASATEKTSDVRKRPGRRKAREKAVAEPPAGGDAVEGLAPEGTFDAASGGNEAPAFAEDEEAVTEPENASEDETQKDEPRRRRASELRLVPSRMSVPAGSEVSVDVMVTGADDVGRINFQLRFNPKVLQFIPPAALGPFLTSDGAGAEIQATESAEGGLIVVSTSRASSEGIDGSGQLLRLRFLALSPGTASFGFAAAQVRAPDSRALSAKFRVANVEVTP